MIGGVVLPYNGSMATTTKKKDQKYGWHFLPADMKLEYGDGRKVSVGKKLKMKGDSSPATCSRGMHASENISDAAKHHKGPVLCRVLVEGDIDTGYDKFCGRYRTVVWMKKIETKDFEAIYKSLGDSSYTKDASGLGAASNKMKFDEVVEAWAKKNGWTSDKLGVSVKLEYEKKELTEDEIKKFLAVGVVRTAKQLREDMKGVYELDDPDQMDEDLESMLNELSNDYYSTICRVEGWASDGEDGYVLKQKKRR